MTNKLLAVLCILVLTIVCFIAYDKHAEKQQEKEIRLNNQAIEYFDFLE